MTQKKIGIGKAHGKIILIGEHSVVYNHMAIAIPLKKINVTCKVEKSEFPVVYNSKNPLSVALFYTLKYLKRENDTYIKYTIHSKIPSKRGMGSSAAVSIALIRALFNYFNEKLTYKVLKEIVDISEKIAHGNPSGLDAMTCMSNKTIKYTKNKGFYNINLNLNAFLIIADTGIYGKTKDAVNIVKNLGLKKDIHINNLGIIAKKIEKNILFNEIKLLGKNLTKAHFELASLNVSCNKSDILVNTALNSGALGAKMTGGGLGGCIIALTNKWEKAKFIEKKLKEKGAVKTWIESI